MSPKLMLAAIPLLPLAGFAVNGIWGRKVPRSVSAAIGVAGPALAFVLSVLAFLACRRADTPLTETFWTWMSVGAFKIDVGFTVDALSAVMLLVVTGVGTLIHVYSIGYMKDDAGFPRYFAYLNLFMFSMLVLVLADNLLLMFVGWEGVGLCSYLLIGFWFGDLKNADAGRKAFIVNRVGDFGFILGILFLLGIFGTVNFTSMGSSAPDPAYAGLLAVPAVLLFLGACGKSAQIPLHVWLPDAMAGPTPVSALIHAATMVTAGVYMIGRLGVLYARVPWVSDLIAIVAVATALMAAITACAQSDIKKILAWSTISQLGFMFVGMATAHFQTGIFHVVTHAFFKALLFLGAGAVIHALHGEQNIWKMGGLWRDLKGVFVVVLVGAFALSGFPLSSGFFSKDAILTAAYEHFQRGQGQDALVWGLVWVGLLATALLTSFYSARMIAVAFLGRKHEAEHGHAAEIHKPGALMMAPLFVLAVLAAFGGLLHHPMEEFLSTVGPDWWINKDPGHDSAHNLNAGISVFVFLAGFGAGLVLYGFKRNLVEGLTKFDLGRGLHKLAANKFYFDEIYQWTIVASVKTAAAVLWFVVDRLLIDRLFVTGSGWLAYRGSRAMKRAHTGVISLAGGAMAAGVVAVLGYLVFRFLMHG